MSDERVAEAVTGYLVERPPTGTGPVLINLAKVDWEMLRQQVEQLSSIVESVADSEGYDAVDGVEGILNLIAYCQDEAAKILGEQVVFGEAKKDKPINAP